MKTQHFYNYSRNTRHMYSIVFWKKMVEKHCFKCTVHTKIDWVFLLVKHKLRYLEKCVCVYVCLAKQWNSMGSNIVLTPFYVLQKKRNAYCWILCKSKKSKNLRLASKHVYLIWKKVGKMTVCMMSIHLLTKDNHTGGYKIWYQPLKIHAGHAHLSSPRCAAQRVLIMIEQFHFFAVSFHMSL